MKEVFLPRTPSFQELQKRSSFLFQKTWKYGKDNVLLVKKHVGNAFLKEASPAPFLSLFTLKKATHCGWLFSTYKVLGRGCGGGSSPGKASPTRSPANNNLPPVDSAYCIEKVGLPVRFRAGVQDAGKLEKGLTFVLFRTIMIIVAINRRLMFAARRADATGNIFILEVHDYEQSIQLFCRPFHASRTRTGKGSR